MNILRRGRALYRTLKRHKIPVTFFLSALALILVSRFWDWFKYKIGVFTALMGLISLNQWAVIVGILCTIITCLVNWYYERKKYLLAEKKAEEENEA